MILAHNLDSFTSADTFNSRQVFVLVCFTVGGYVYGIFGSGTKLYVSGKQVVKPVVSVYPAASRDHLEGKSSLLCLASAMFPPLVQFSWKRQKDNGPEEEVPSAEGEQLELRESGRTAAILLIRHPENSTYKYRCHVQHEGGTVEAQSQQADSVLPPTGPPPSLPPVSQTSLPPSPPPSPPPSLPPSPPPSLQASPPPSPPPAEASVQSQCRVKLLLLMYTVLIVKSLVYCCGLSLLMIFRNKGSSTICTHAD